ncbi:response regulator transcription factor [Actinacidiphila acidipaludis]|uniref:Response regulator transcription factor n=1 Tax=Actinacidiphila acidipaludis TaxID=2873382 RepID=A0ABS7QFT0_9ACTN|nr:response regulator transcription factor [Streptomyces acidipaludis]MBY8882012.1 response regulator transcription factor [Streptomyces acidipaludis]
MASVLVVEDDPVIRSSLIEALTAFGHVVRSAADGFGCLREVTRIPFDAVVLDLGLPDLDGGDALRMLRGISQVPVVVATARDDETEIIRLLNSGADDYLVKPFSAGQLEARIAAVLRRSQAPRPRTATPGGGGRAGAAPLRVGDLQIDVRARTVELAGRELALTRREFDLLAYLAVRAGTVVSKQELLTEVWREPYVDDQTVHVHLSALRRKLGERASRARYLHTVRGVGFKLVAPR